MNRANHFTKRRNAAARLVKSVWGADAYLMGHRDHCRVWVGKMDGRPPWPGDVPFEGELADLEIVLADRLRTVPA